MTSPRGKPHPSKLPPSIPLTWVCVIEASIGVVIGCSMMAWIDPPIAEAAASLLGTKGSGDKNHLIVDFKYFNHFPRLQPFIPVRSIYLTSHFQSACVGCQLWSTLGCMATCSRGSKTRPALASRTWSWSPWCVCVERSRWLLPWLLLSPWEQYRAKWGTELAVSAAVHPWPGTPGPVPTGSVTKNPEKGNNYLFICELVSFKLDMFKLGQYISNPINEWVWIIRNWDKHLQDQQMKVFDPFTSTSLPGKQNRIQRATRKMKTTCRRSKQRRLMHLKGQKTNVHEHPKNVSNMYIYICLYQHIYIYMCLYQQISIGDAVAAKHPISIREFASMQSKAPIESFRPNIAEPASQEADWRLPSRGEAWIRHCMDPPNPNLKPEWACCQNGISEKLKLSNWISPIFGLISNWGRQDSLFKVKWNVLKIDTFWMLISF